MVYLIKVFEKHCQFHLFLQPVFYILSMNQPSIGVPRERCSENMQQIYLRTFIPKCDFNKVALLCNFIEITLRYGCFPVNLLRIFKTTFLHIEHQMYIQKIWTDPKEQYPQNFYCLGIFSSFL